MDQDNFTRPKRKAPGRSRDTLFRVAFRNQIQLIAIADSKANIILSINSLIISVIIAIMSSGYFMASGVDMVSPLLLVPVVTIILSSLVSAVFSILAAKPNIIKSSPSEGANAKRSLLFFGNIYGKTMGEYLAEMDQLLSSNNLIQEHLVIDLYNQGQVLNRKYKLIGYAYLVFMVGIIMSVLSFLSLWVIS